LLVVCKSLLLAFTPLVANENKSTELTMSSPMLWH